MDRIAIISDIHGNIPALKAALADIRRRGIETVYCLGDLVGKGPEPDAAVDLCREHCDLVVGGNWDDLIRRETDDPTIRWHQRRLGPERLAYLGALPPVIDFQMSGRSVRLFHASQEGIYHRVHYDAPYGSLLAMFGNTSFTGQDRPLPDVVGYGDIHVAFSLSLHRDHKCLFNAGSVGNPLDEPLASYAVLEGCYGGGAPAPFSLQLVRVPYDVEAAIELATRAAMPELEPFAVELRTAVYRGRQ